MIQRFSVTLPFGDKSIELCDICGTSSDIGLSSCHRTPALGTPDVCIGDVVDVFEPRRRGDRITTELKHERYRVSDLFYAGLHSTVIPRGYGDLTPPLHKLCITLAQGHGPNGWEPLDKELHSSRSWFSITWDEFVLLRQGDVPTMQAVGLLPRRKVRKGIISRIFGTR